MSIQNRLCVKLLRVAATGGVVPKLAMEAHQAAIDGVVELALQRAGVAAHQLDAVAVTIGPGLGLCLRVSAIPFSPKEMYTFPDGACCLKLHLDGQACGPNGTTRSGNQGCNFAALAWAFS